MKQTRTVERFKQRTVWFHWAHSLSFLLLLVTGAILFFPGTGGLASGGATRVIHRVAAVIFVAAPLIYLPFNPRMSLSFLKDVFVWGKDDLVWLTKAPDYYFGGDESKMPPQGHINTGQKLWQAIVVATWVTFLLSGTVMWFFKPVVTKQVFQFALIIHDVSFLAAMLMFLVHIYLSVLHPRMTESLRSMIDGRISPDYAAHHYGKWYDKIRGNRGLGEPVPVTEPAGLAETMELAEPANLTEPEGMAVLLEDEIEEITT